MKTSQPMIPPAGYPGSYANVGRRGYPSRYSLPFCPFSFIRFNFFALTIFPSAHIMRFARSATAPNLPYLIDLSPHQRLPPRQQPPNHFFRRLLELARGYFGQLTARPLIVRQSVTPSHPPSNRYASSLPLPPMPLDRHDTCPAGFPTWLGSSRLPKCKSVNPDAPN